MEEGFVKGQSDNLPRIDIYTVLDFYSSNQSYVSAEIKGVKLFRAAREYYEDEAISYVQVKREGSKCTIKCRVSPEHKVKNKPYHCTLVCDEYKGIVESVVCHDCAANQGGCKHTVAFLIWIFKRSEEPATTSVKCYWKKPALSKVGSQTKFIKAKDFKNKKSSDLNITEDTTFLNKFVTECKNRKPNDVQIMSYFMDVNIEMKASLHYLICKYKNEKHESTKKDFIEFCKHNITEDQCVLIEKATRDQPATSLWFELRYGRITASIAHEASKCSTPDSVLVEKILGAYQLKEPLAVQRRKLLKDQVRSQIEIIKKIRIEKCGLFLAKEHPMLCASPDSVTEEHTIEIKCPLKSKTMSKYMNKVKLTAKYEAEVQLQMHFANKSKGFFCIAHEDFETSKHVDVYEILYDSNLCKKVIDECILFWKHIFNAMIK